MKKLFSFLLVAITLPMLSACFFADNPLDDTPENEEQGTLGYLRLSQDDLNGWNEGICFTVNGEVINPYVVSSTDQENGTSIVYIGKYNNNNISEGMVMNFTSEGLLLDVLFAGYRFEAHHNENNITFVVYDDNGNTIGSFDVPYADMGQITRAPFHNSKGKLSIPKIAKLGKIAAATVDLAGSKVVDFFSLINSIENGKYGEIIEDFLAGRLVGLVAEGVVAEIVAPIAAKEYAERLYENDKKWFLGSSKIEITSIKRTSNTTITVEGQISSVSSIPESRIVVDNGIQGYVKNNVFWRS